jgi:hypothetical protein
LGRGSRQRVRQVTRQTSWRIAITLLTQTKLWVCHLAALWVYHETRRLHSAVGEGGGGWRTWTK